MEYGPFKGYRMPSVVKSMLYALQEACLVNKMPHYLLYFYYFNLIL